VTAAQKHAPVALIVAASWDDIGVVKEILSRGDDVDEKNENGRTALMVTISKEIAALLISKDASLDLQDNRGATALLWAAHNNRARIVALLLENGASIDLKDNEGYTPLSWASAYGWTDVMLLLLVKGASIDENSNEGETPLMRAADCSHPEAVRLLIEKGAALDAVDNDGKTVLERMEQRYAPTIVQILKDAHEARRRAVEVEAAVAAAEKERVRRAVVAGKQRWMKGKASALPKPGYPS